MEVRQEQPSSLWLKRASIPLEIGMEVAACASVHWNSRAWDWHLAGGVSEKCYKCSGELGVVFQSSSRQ